MSAPEDNSELVSGEIYHQSYADLSRLHTQLPEKAVVQLAREVLERLAQKLSDRSTRDDTIVDLTTALIGPEPEAAAQLIERRLRAGDDVHALYLDFLAPAALELGDRWKSDDITFADVTVGTGRIYAIMRTLRRRMTVPRGNIDRNAFFAAVPNDNHTLGVKMAADLARKDGWNVEFEIDGTHAGLLEQIEAGDHMLIGLSGGGKHSVPDLARLVMALRIQRPGAMILVSGNVVDAARESVRLMHVDAMERDFPNAMNALERLRKSLAQPAE